MPTSETGLHWSKWRLTHIVTLLSVIAGLGSYGWYIYTLMRDAQHHKPQPQIEKLLKDLRTYHISTKQFPHNFAEINQRLWHTTPPPDYGKDEREARTKNYYYRYTKVNADGTALAGYGELLLQKVRNRCVTSWMRSRPFTAQRKSPPKITRRTPRP